MPNSLPQKPNTVESLMEESRRLREQSAQIAQRMTELSKKIASVKAEQTKADLRNRKQ